MMKNKPLPDYLDQTSIAGMGRRASEPYQYPGRGQTPDRWSVFAAVIGALAVLLACFL